MAPKIPFFRNFRQKSYLKQIFHHNFRKKTFIPLLPLSPKNKLLPALKTTWRLSKSHVLLGVKFVTETHSKIRMCQKWTYLRFVSNFVFLVSHCNVPPGSSTQNLKSFCCKWSGWDPENWPFRAFSDNVNVIFFTLNMPKQTNMVKNSELLLFYRNQPFVLEKWLFRLILVKLGKDIESL